MADDPLRAWLEGFVRDPGFLGKYPYYAAILARMHPVADPSVESMAVSFETAGPGGAGRFYLHVNIEHFMQAPQFVRGILLHEVHHVVLGHLTNPKFFGVAHPQLLEIAEEVSANEHVEEDLPDPITWKTYEALGLRPGQSTLERYEKLVAAAAAGKTLGKSPHFIDAHRFGAGGEGAPPPGGLEWTRDLIEQAVGEAPAPPESRPLLAGRLPGRLVEDLVGITGAAEGYVDWKTALRRFVARARAPVHTWSRPSRRFPSRIGEVPGRVWSLRPVLRPTLLVAIDTSMSMSDRELAEIARQLTPLAEEARLVVAQCDVEITKVHAFEGALPKVKGRGGTDLRPVFAPEFLHAHRPDGVVYFTDGQGPYPSAPPEVPVLWILTKPATFACPWGDRAKLFERATVAPPPSSRRSR